MAGALFLVGLLAAGAATTQGAVVAREQASVTPVQKVIMMLNDMMAKGKKEKQEEQVLFATYAQFCTSTSAEKTKAIAKGKQTIEKLSADIAKAEEDVIVNQKGIASHDADIASWTAEKDEAEKVRKQEAADYQVVYNDYTSAMDSVERAIQTVKSGASSLLETKDSVKRVAELTLAPTAARRVLESFLQESQTPEVAAYESQNTGGVVEIVTQMGDKFEEKRSTLEKEEMTKRFAFDSLFQDLSRSIEEAEKERGEKSERVQASTSEKAQKTGDKEATKADLAADEKFLSDLQSECNVKSQDFEKRQELRQGELEAIAKAIEIMSGAAVAGGTQHLPSFAQLRSNSVSAIQGNVAAFLKQRAEQTQSRLLSLVATRIKDDPFKKVTKMIEDMITKLMEEANEEAEHKGFCDQEMGTNKVTREQKTEEVAELSAKAEKLTADIKKLAEEVAVLGEEISVIDAEVSKATSERQAEKEKNTATIAEAKVAQAATMKAIEVLREFYAGAAEATALAQFRSGEAVPGAPETFDKPYTGMGGSAGGVMGMLETIESDFARLDAETTAGEAEAERVYNRFMTDSKKDKAVKTKDMDNKSGQKVEAESELAGTKKDLASSQEELSAAMEYFEKLKPSCVEAGVSYEERVAKRKEEIESLQEALKILG